MIEFLHRPSGLYVSRVKPAKVVWFKERDFLVTVLSRGLVTIDGDFELVAEVLVESFEGDGSLCSFNRRDVFLVYGEFGVVTLVREERGELGRGVRSVVVCELRERKKGDPIVLLIIDIDAKVLFEYLIDVFRLAVSFWVIRGGEVGFDMEELREGRPEPRDEVLAAV